MALLYDDGNFHSSYNHVGDGLVGEDVSNNVKDHPFHSNAHP